MQSFVVAAYPLLLSGSQFVPSRLDFDQCEFFLAMNEEIRPACIATPLVLNEIAKDLHERIDGHDINQLSGNLDVLSSMRPQIVSKIAARAEPLIEYAP